MKTIVLTAAVLLAIGTAAASAETADPDRAACQTPCPRALGSQKLPGASDDTRNNRSYSAQSEAHDAWQYNGLNGGGG